MKHLLLITLAIAPLLGEENETAKRLEEAAAVFSEVMATPDKAIPQDLLEKAHCIVIVPGLKKGGFHRGWQIRKRISVLPEKEGRGLVCTGHGPD